jgi:uncharacterized protein
MISNSLARRLRSRAFLVAALAALVVTTIANAERAVRWNEVTVEQGESAAAFQEAMRIALVRATGKRDADADPALGTMVSQARRYVQVFKPASGGGTQITFDGAAIERAIAAAGRTVWARERPVTLVILRDAAGDSSDDTRKTVSEVALLRGLPIAMGSASAGGIPTAGDVSREVALSALARQGADAVLVGDGSAGTWRWTLHTPALSENWAGAIGDGVHGTVDALVRAADAIQALPELETVVEVAGVNSLKDYATVSTILTNIGGVRRAGVSETAQGLAVFRVAARGGLDTVLGALASDARFERAEPGAGGAAAFRYRGTP